MKKILYSIVIFLLHNNIQCQVDNGRVVYKVIFAEDPKEDIYKKSARNGAKTLEFELLFNKTSSLFQQVDKIENEDAAVKFACAFSGYKNPVYYDKAKKEYKYNNFASPIVNEKEFLIIYKDSIGWTLLNETKIINNYTCYKATSLVPVYKINDVSFTTITAWYCPQIAINYGPLTFGNLPGLIFELQNQYSSLVIDKIEFNSEIKIKEPIKGVLITELEFNSLFNNRIKEITEELNKKK